MRSLSACALVLSAALALPAQAQTFPNRAVRLIVSAAAGGGPDTTARTIAPRLTEALGQQLIVDNRGGANGSIGADLVARAVPDGYTWLFATGQHAANPRLQKSIAYDLQKDFAPVSLVVTNTYFLVVHPSLPAKSVKDLVALARARPGRLNFGSGGIGSASHFAAELFKVAAKVDMVHVPYKGVGLAFSDLLGGHLELMFPAIPGSLPHVRNGRLRGLAVTSAQRNAALPDMPTIAEAGLPGYDFQSWIGVVVPAATPPETVRTIHAAIVRVMSLPDVRESLTSQGNDPLSSTPEAFGAFIREQVTRFARLIEASGMKPE